MKYFLSTMTMFFYCLFLLQLKPVGLFGSEPIYNSGILLLLAIQTAAFALSVLVESRLNKVHVNRATPMNGIFRKGFWVLVYVLATTNFIIAAGAVIPELTAQTLEVASWAWCLLIVIINTHHKDCSENFNIQLDVLNPVNEIIVLCLVLLVVVAIAMTGSFGFLWTVFSVSRLIS